MKLTNKTMTAKRHNKILGYALGRRGLESQELKSLNEAIKTCQDIIVDLMRKVDPNKIKIENTNDIYKLGNALSGLARARVETEKVSLEMNGLFALAADAIKTEIQGKLADHPEIYAQLAPLIDQATLEADIRLQAAADAESSADKTDDENLN